MATEPTIAETHAALTAAPSMFEMDEADVFGTRLRVWKYAPASLRVILDASRGRGDAAFIVYEDEVLTFEEHYRAAAHLAEILIERFGVEKGDRVAIVMRNFPEWSIAFWAAAAAGAIVVPLNAWWTGDELEYGLQDSGSKVVFVDAERLDRLTDVLPKLDLRTVVVRSDVDDTRAERWEDLLGDVPAAAELPAVELGPEDLATIFYTSGTTGRPKGALGTHRNICGNLISLAFAARRARRCARGRSLHPRRARTCTCCRCPSSTPRAATPYSWPTSRPAASSC